MGASISTTDIHRHGEAGNAIGSEREIAHGGLLADEGGLVGEELLGLGLVAL